MQQPYGRIRGDFSPPRRQPWPSCGRIEGERRKDGFAQTHKDSNSHSRMTGCFAHLEGAVTAGVCARWLASIERSYAADKKDFSPYSSSMRLFSIPEIEPDAVRTALSGSGLIASCERALGGPVVCDADECWTRRQYAPGNYPPLHAPHSWHQDGALRFDFHARSGRQPPPEAVLDMMTCWIPLTECGVSAPGMELVTRRPEGLVAPADLTDDRVRARFAPQEFWQPVMQTGDALMFRGGVLHRTHVTPTMTKERTSVELRLFPAHRIPERLKGDRFVPFA